MPFLFREPINGVTHPLTLGWVFSGPQNPRRFPLSVRYRIHTTSISNPYQKYGKVEGTLLIHFPNLFHARSPEIDLRATKISFELDLHFSSGKAYFFPDRCLLFFFTETVSKYPQVYALSRRFCLTSAGANWLVQKTVLNRFVNKLICVQIGG